LYERLTLILGFDRDRLARGRILRGGGAVDIGITAVGRGIGAIPHDQGVPGGELRDGSREGLPGEVCGLTIVPIVAASGQVEGSAPDRLK